MKDAAVDIKSPGKEAGRAGRATVVLIAGPTASGKSALAQDIAQRCDGTVINADSMQVYRELRVLSARPSEAEMGAVPHLLYGHVAASERYSVGRWLEDVAGALEAVRRAGRLPVLVGGTGLYFQALTEGLAPVPPVPPEIRRSVEARLDLAGPQALHRELALRDPAGAAVLNPGDRTRIVRALEVVEATGRPLAEWQRSAAPSLVGPAAALKLVILPERAALAERIAARLQRMIGEGALAEVAALDALGLDPALPAMKAIGVPQLREHLAGALPLDAALEAVASETRRYAKRQATWLRGRMRDWHHLDANRPEAIAALIERQEGCS